MKTIIIDGLEWQADDNGIQRTWDEALEYANDLSDCWRLPTIEELISLIDFNSFQPACHIKNSRSSHYWSSSPYAYGSSYAWYVFFYNGAVGYYVKDSHYYVRCVRNIK